MLLLNGCQSGAVQDRKLFKVELKDPKTGQSLEITSETSYLAAYMLDAEGWGPGKRPDWVLVVEPNSSSLASGLVCFLEQKGHPPEDEERPFEQIRGGIDHFAPTFQHGREHHDRWKKQEDLPQAMDQRHPKDIQLPEAHLVVGAIQCSRGGTRVKPRIETRGGKKIRIVPLQLHGSRGKSSLELSQLLGLLGLG